MATFHREATGAPLLPIGPLRDGHQPDLSYVPLIAPQASENQFLSSAQRLRRLIDSVY